MSRRTAMQRPPRLSIVDVSEVDGVSAAVLVVHSDQGRTAWAVDRYCTTGNTGLIRGPVSLD